MSYKKIKVIGPESVRKPEIGYVYLGYGYSTTFDDTAPWIKKEDGSFYLISGGTGGGGSSYWIKDGTDLYYNAAKVFINSDNAATTTSQTLNVNGAIRLGTTSMNTAGSIRWTGTNFEGNTGGTAATWVSLTERGGGGGEPTTTYWLPNAQGIQNRLANNVYVTNTGLGVSAADDLLTVTGGITLSDTTKTNVGTIRYNTSTSDFEGYIGTKWYSLTAGEHTADTNEFIYNDSGGALVGAPTLKYSTGGIAINLTEATAYSSFEVNGSFGAKTTFTSSNITLDENHHTIICTNSSPTDINITLSPLAVSINREYTICRYGTGNISIGVSVETPYTQYIRFYDVDNSWLDFDTDRPLGSSDKLILYSVTLRATYSGGLYRWYVTHFSSASTP